MNELRSSPADTLRAAPGYGQLALFALAALAMRAFVLADPIVHIDENWYLTVGRQMALGDRLYLDLWDRKPPGLFLIFRAAAALPDPLLAYQLAATASAAATAWLIWRMARGLGSRAGAWVGGLMYLTLLVQLGGQSGQSPVFYNLLIAGAAWLTLPDKGAPTVAAWRRPYLAMLLAGSAILVKPTAAFEAAFLGLWTAWGFWSAGGENRIGRIGLLLTTGLVPAIATALWFAATGGLGAMWQATVVSGFVKAAQMQDQARNFRVLVVLLVLAIPLLSAFLTLVLPGDRPARKQRLFLAGWLAAAVMGVVAVPNFYDHYLLPLLLPLTVAAAPFFGRSRALTVLGVLAASIPLLQERPWDFSMAAGQKSAYRELVRAVCPSAPGAQLFVFGGPPSLYPDCSSPVPSPLAFPPHLWDRAERDVSPLATSAEVGRILSTGPDTVVLEAATSPIATNFATRSLVEQYVTRACAERREIMLPGWSPDPRLWVYRGCGSPSRAMADGFPERD